MGNTSIAFYNTMVLRSLIAIDDPMIHLNIRNFAYHLELNLILLDSGAQPSCDWLFLVFNTMIHSNL